MNAILGGVFSKRVSGGWAVTLKDARRRGLLPSSDPLNVFSGVLRWFSSDADRLIRDALSAREE